jgi:hypothetical protein
MKTLLCLAMLGSTVAHAATSAEIRAAVQGIKKQAARPKAVRLDAKGMERLAADFSADLVQKGHTNVKVTPRGDQLDFSYTPGPKSLDQVRLIEGRFNTIDRNVHIRTMK